MNDYQEEGGGGGEDKMAVATGDSNYSLTEAEFRSEQLVCCHWTLRGRAVIELRPAIN